MVSAPAADAAAGRLATPTASTRAFVRLLQRSADWHVVPKTENPEELEPVDVGDDSQGLTV